MGGAGEIEGLETAAAYQRFQKYVNILSYMPACQLTIIPGQGLALSLREGMNHK